MTSRRHAYASARRLQALRKLLSTPHGVTMREALEHLDVSRFTAMRMLEQLERGGDTVIREGHSASRTYRIEQQPRERDKTPSLAEMFVFELAWRSFAGFGGTGLTTYLDGIRERLLRTCDKKRLAEVKDLAPMIDWVEDMPWLFGESEDVLDELITGMVNRQSVRVTYETTERGKRSFRFDPYAIQHYRGGFNFVGYSHFHKQNRSFGLDAISHAERIDGERFERPESFDPAAERRGAFGLIGGLSTDVVVRFDAQVARYATRRRWHHTQRFVHNADGSVDLQVRVDGTTGLRNELLRWNEHVEVLAPATLRAEMARLAAKMAERHARSVEPETDDGTRGSGGDV